MSTRLRTCTLSSPSELRNCAPTWNDLWLRSQSTRPTARAEQLALWCEHFAHNALRAIVVLDGDRPLAALPLTVASRWPLQLVCTPGNAWTPAGELLLDPSVEPEPLLDALLAGVQSQLRGLLWLDGLMLGSQANEQLLARCAAQNFPQTFRRRFDVPLTEISGTWSVYLASRSRNVRKQLQNIVRRAQMLGGIELHRYEGVTPRQAEALTRECFELEAAGWKGQAESAVLNSPIATEFFLSQARQLAADGQLAIAALRHRGQIIAFEYGWQVYGVRGVLKIGYQERYARVSPGQLLRYRLLSELFHEAEGTTRWLDYLGPGSRATRAWATHHYEVGRALCAVDSRVARLALAACRAKRRLLGSRAKPLSPESEVSTPAGLPMKQARELAGV